MAERALQEKSYDFAVRIVKMCRHLIKEHHEFVLSKQVLRSGKAIGAMVAEADYGQSLPDFISKLSIAAKEASETFYWLRLLKDTETLSTDSFTSLSSQLDEIRRLLTASIKTAKSRLASS